MQTIKGFREIDHTADVALEVWGASLEDLFQQALFGMYAICGAIPGGVSSEKFSKSMHIEAEDMETLLVNFLSEMLYLLMDDTICEMNSLRIQDSHLDVELRGQFFDTLQREIKAVTFHQLKIEASDTHYRTCIVFDI